VQLDDAPLLVKMKYHGSELEKMLITQEGHSFGVFYQV